MPNQPALAVFAALVAASPFVWSLPARPGPPPPQPAPSTSSTARSHTAPSSSRPRPASPALHAAARTSAPQAPSTQAPAAPPAAGRMVLGYYVPGSAAWADFTSHIGQLSAVAPFLYSVRINGTLNTLSTAGPAVTAFAHAHHVAVYPMVINGYGNDTILKNPSLMQSDIQTLLSLVAANGYDGLNVDFESLNNPDQTGFDQFVQTLADGLHAMGKKLVVSVGPRTSDANAYHVYDYRFLGGVADYIDLMTYDDHDSGGAAGPVAPLSWVENIVAYAAAVIPPQKVLVGLAGYGYNWASTGSTETSDAGALALARQYGSTWVGGTAQEPEIVYTANHVTHTVWFEDSQSAAEKVTLVAKYHLGGVALWDLGEEDSGFWPMLQSDLP